MALLSANIERLFVSILIFLFVSQPADSFASGKLRPQVGIIDEVKGAPDVLRYPVSVIDDALKARAQAEDFSIVLYKEKYWEAYSLKSGSKLYYGDVLSSGSSSKMVLTLKDGFKIVMAKNTKIRITPRFLTQSQKSTFGSWVYLLGGRMRAYFKKNSESSETKFRSRTIALGVRGTDFVFETGTDKSRVLTIEGLVEVRSVDKEEAEAFEKLSQGYVRGNEKELSQEVKVLESIKPKKGVLLSKAEKIDLETTPFETELKVEKIKRSDLQAINDIAKDLKIAEKDLVETINSEEVPARAPEPLPIERASSLQKTLSLRLGIGNAGIDSQDFEAKGGGLGLEIKYRPFKYVFFDLGIMSGSWDMRDSPDANSEEILRLVSKRYTHYTFGMGIRYIWWDYLSLSLAATYLSNRQLKYENQFGRFYDLRVDSVVILRLEISYNIWKNLELFVTLGGNDTQGQLEITDPDGSLNDDRIDLQLNFFQIGLGWAVDSPDIFSD